MKKRITSLVLIITFIFALYPAYAGAADSDKYLELYSKLLEVKSPFEIKPILMKNRELLDNKFLGILQASADEFHRGNKVPEATFNYAVLSLAAEVKNNTELESKTLVRLGWCLEKVKQHHMARVKFKRAMALSRKNKDFETFTHAATGNAEVDLNTFKKNNAKFLAENSLRFQKKKGIIKGRAENLRILALVAAKSKKTNEARKLFEEAIDAAKAEKNNDVLIRTMEGMIIVFMRAKDVGSIENTLRDLTVLFKKQGDMASYGKSLNALAMVSAFQKNYDKGAKYLLEAKDVFMQNGIILDEANTTAVLAGYYLKKGDTDKALETGQEAKYLYNQAGAVPGYLESLLGLAKISLEAKKYEIAVGYANEALEGYKALNMPLGEFRANMSLSNIYKTQGNKEEAEKYFKAAFKISREKGINMNEDQQESGGATPNKRAGRKWRRKQR